MRSKSKIVDSTILTGVLLFVLTAMSGVSILDAIKLSLIVAAQVSGGAALWFIANDYEPIEIPATIGMGLAIGTSITTLFQSLFRETVASNYSWLVPLIFLIPILKKSNSNLVCLNDAKSQKIKFNESFSVTAIVALTMLALASLWWWLYPIAVAIFYICFQNYKNLKNPDKVGAPGISVIAISLSGFAASALLSRHNNFWILVSNDQVFSESLSWSIFKLGNSDSPFVAGTPINYHWFVLLWSGIISSATNAQSWVVITRVIPVVSFLGIFCLIWTITKKIYSRLSAPIIAILFLIFYSNNFESSFTRYIASPTFLFSCVWLLAFSNSVFSFYRMPSIRYGILSAFLLFMTFGGKVTSGAVGICAVLFALTIWIFVEKQWLIRFKIVILALFSITSLIAIYLFMFSKNQPGNLNTLTLGNQLPLQSGLLQREKNGIYSLLVNLFLFIAIMLPLAATSIYSIQRRFRSKFEVWFIMGSQISGLILVYTTSHPGVSQLYFWLSSLTMTAILIPSVVFGGFDSEISLKPLIPIGLIALLAGFINIDIWDQSKNLGISFQNIIIKSFAIFIGLLFLALSTSFLFLLGKNKKRIKLHYCQILLLSTFVFFNLGIGTNQSISNLVQHARIEMSDPEDPNLITGSRDHLQILKWIRNNSDETDVIATNRFCIPGISSCISKWQLVSAVSHRRMLFEGGYYELPSIPDQELYRRYILSSEFGGNPSFVGLEQICKYGVKWYFFDHSISDPLVTWEPYASIQFQNESVSLLRLRCPTS